MPRRLAVGEPRGAVDGVGRGRAEHHPHAGAGEDDVRLLGVEVQAGDLAGPQVEADGRDRAAEHDGALGADPVEHPPADLRGDHEADEEVQDVDAGVRGRLAERDLRVLAGEEEHRDEHQHRDPEHDVLDEERADLEDAHFDQRRLGAAARRSRSTTSSTAPMTMQAQVAGLLQPQIEDCWKPNTLSATPAAIRARPL